MPLPGFDPNLRLGGAPAAPATPAPGAPAAPPPPGPGAGMVPIVRHDTGQIEVFPEADADAAIAAGGRVANPEEYHKAQLEAKWAHKGAKGLVAFGAGALRGLSLGVSDKVITEGAELLLGAQKKKEVREYLHDLKEIRPWYSGGGEMAGAVLGTVATGGESGLLAGERLAAQGGVRALAAGERAAGLATAREIAALRAENVLARGATGLETRGVEAAAEAARAEAYANSLRATQQAAAAANGSTLRHALRYNPAGLADAAGGAAGRHVGAFVEEGLGGGSAARLLGKTAQGFTQAATEAVPFAVGRTFSEAELGDERVTAEKILANVKHDAFMFGKVGGALGAAGGLLGMAASKLAPKLRETAAEQAVRALNPSAPEIRALRRSKDGVRDMGEWLLEKDLVKAGDTFEHVAARMPKVREATEKAFSELANTVAGLPSANVSTTNLMDRVKLDVLVPLQSKIGMEHVAGYVDRYLGSIRSHTAQYIEKDGIRIFNGYRDMSMAEARMHRAALDDLLKRSFKAVDPGLDAVEAMQVRKIFEDEILTSFERVGKEIKDPELVNAYKAIKRDYKHLRSAEDMIEKAEVRDITNRGFSPTDYLTTIGSTITGSILGGGIGGAVKGFGLGALHKIARERGRATTAVALRELADFGTLKSLTAKTDQAVESGIKGYLAPPRKVKLRTYEADSRKGKDLGAQYDDAVGHMRSIGTDGEKIQRELEAKTAGMDAVAPNTRIALSGTIARALSFLSGKMPQGQPTNLLQPGVDPNLVTDSEKEKFLTYYKTVTDPMTVIEDLKAGHVTPEQIETLEQVYPHLYNQVRSQLMQEIGAATAAKQEIPYQKLLQIGTLFKTPTHATMEPKFVGMMQQVRRPQPQENKRPPGRPPGSGGMDSIGANMMTMYDRRQAEMR